jgi:glyceraldehyde-3-phosphate dehydrogenase (NADP+)
MNTIPEEFQINTLLNQDTYLVDGELKKMDRSNHSSFFSTYLLQQNMHQLLGSVPLMGEAEAAEVVLSASTAFNNGQAYYESDRSNKMR